MTKKFYEKLGPVPTKEDLKNPKQLNPNKARNWVITWYLIVAISIIIYFIATNLF
jgi:capsular polysaccharide biosynthesis protein|tara:strand:- start:972 stop:1136 length:165 start_codon:yes stop_codon:yes gene_type:complete